jgi:peptidoglycan/xylan/chitin deacetylase (PgdA/CDA1 family)
MIRGLAPTLKGGLLARGWYARHLERATFPGVVVLCYHGVRSPAWRAGETAFPNLHVREDTFEGHCQVIAQTCQPIGLDDWRTALAGGPALPPRPVLVTFDDGYRSVFEVARPLLKRHRIPAVIFVCTDPVREQELFWFDTMARKRGEEHAYAWRLPPPDDQRGGADRVAVDADPLAPLSVAQVRALAADGFEIGVHTASHCRLSSLTPDQQQRELSSCREALEEWTGRRVTALAYPWGKRDADYTHETVAIAGRLGFDTGFTTRPDFARPDEPPLERSRFLIVSDVTAAELAHRLAYSWPR